MCSLILPFAIYLRFLTARQRDAVIVAQEAVSGGWCTARADHGRARCAAAACAELCSAVWRADFSKLRVRDHPRLFPLLPPPKKGFSRLVTVIYFFNVITGVFVCFLLLHILWLFLIQHERGGGVVCKSFFVSFCFHQKWIIFSTEIVNDYKRDSFRVIMIKNKKRFQLHANQRSRQTAQLEQSCFTE